MIDELARWELEKLPVLNFLETDNFFNYPFTYKFLHIREVFAGYMRKNKPPTAQCMDWNWYNINLVWQDDNPKRRKRKSRKRKKRTEEWLLPWWVSWTMISVLQKSLLAHPHWICKHSWKSCCADQETTLPSLFDEAIFANSKLWDEPLPSYNELTWLGFYTRPRAPIHWRCPRRPARLEFIYHICI